MTLAVSINFPSGGVTGVKTLNSSTQSFTLTHTITGDENWDGVRHYVNGEMVGDIVQTPSKAPGVYSYPLLVSRFNLGVSNSWYVSVKGATSGEWYTSSSTDFTPHSSGYYDVFNAIKTFPTSNAIDIITNPVLTWSEGAYADGYNLFVDYWYNGSWINIINNVDIGNVLSFQLTDLHIGAQYRWKVVAYYKDIYRTKSTSPYYTFYAFIYSTTASYTSFVTEDMSENLASLPTPADGEIGVIFEPYGDGRYYIRPDWTHSLFIPQEKMYFGKSPDDLRFQKLRTTWTSPTYFWIWKREDETYYFKDWETSEEIDILPTDPFYWRVDSYILTSHTTGTIWCFNAPTFPPEITGQSEDMSVRLGEQVNLLVTVTGTPPLTYQWYKDDVEISGETNSTLSFYTDADSPGVYKCKITNEGGTIWSDPIVLIVTPNPYCYNLFNLQIDLSRTN